MELCTVAWCVLPEGTEAGWRTCLCHEQTHLDRDQLHALPAAKREDLQERGRDCTRRFRLLGERAAARDPAKGPGRDRQLHQALLRVGLGRTRRQARTGALAICAVQTL